MSPRQKRRATPCASMSASTACKASRFAWMSENTAKRDSGMALDTGAQPARQPEAIREIAHGLRTAGAVIPPANAGAAWRWKALLILRGPCVELGAIFGSHRGE